MGAPRRVVHCVRSDSFAGVERYVASVAPELARRGWQVEVIGGEPLRMRAELGPVPHKPAATTRAVAAQLLQLPHGSVVHTHMTAAEAAATAVWVIRRFPLVTTRHFAAPRGSTSAGRLGARLISRVVDRQIATSHFVAESIGEPSIVILNGVPFNDRQPTPERNVLVAQRLEPEKCTDLAIQAWTRSKLMNEGWRLTIAGRGSQETTLIHLVASLGVQDSVDFVGVQADMRPLMSRASIFLATTPTESFGLSAVEAMAAGLPVVAARGGAHLETIGAADERWLFPVGDARVAAAMLDSLGDDAVERSRLSAGLRAWQREHLSIGTHVDQLEKVYEELRR